ncbi:MAG: TIM44-like domain-containing protein [Planctomycetes bacterium]|nr:TIM44-like domain-containing protein [Planctomycetota bacterium]
MTPNSAGKYESTAILGRLSTVVASSATARLRLAFLVPLAGAVAALFGIGIAALHMHERDMVESEVKRAQTLVERMYREDIGHNAQSLDVAMEVVGHDAALRAALARRDRAALLRLSAPLYTELRRKFGITHFYFSGPDRVNLLRVHQPERHGDVIARFTTLEAERTGAMAYGVELGPLGTFTLRLVTPWYEGGRLIGYVELGMEIDHVLDTVQKFAGVPVFVLVSKQYLKREDWEAGMRMLGRTPEWDRFPDAVLSTQASEAMPAALAARLAGGLPTEASVVETTQARAIYRAAFLPLVDANGRDVGRMVALVDVSAPLASSRRMLYLGDGIGALIYLLFRLFLLLWDQGPVGKFFALLLLGGAIAGFIWYGKHKKNQKDKLDDQGRILHSHRAQRQQSRGVQQILQFDPNFSRVLFLDFARLVYVKFHESRGGMARKSDENFAVAPYLAPDIRAQVKTARTKVHEVIVGAIELQSVNTTHNEMHVNVNIRANVVEGPDGGEPTRYFLEQKLTFVRPKTAITQPPEKVLSLGCPGCGSPEEPKMDGRCPSCGSLTGRGEMDWQIKRIQTTKRQHVGPPIGAKGGVEVGTDHPTIFAPDLGAKKRSLGTRDPNFSWEGFHTRTSHIFHELQRAWSAQHESAIRPYVTDTLFDTVRYWMGRYRETGVREMLEDVRITRVLAAKIEHDAWFDAITVRIYASMREWQVDRGGNVISGNPNKPRAFSEYWTMIRRSDRAHDKPKDPRSCPNCGAPLDRVNMGGICEYCNGKIISGDFDWVLAIITQDEDYVG